MSNLKLREQQVAALTEEEREKGDDSNPILYAESGPCRYQSVTYWFPEEDGVIIEQNMDDEDDITVKYMNGDETIELTEGPLFEWAIDQYENN
jgi:uncharacterized membrane-anchored protein